MNETMESQLARLPEDFRPAAEALWRHSRAVTDETTETLRIAYRLLNRMRGEPESLAAAADELSHGTVAELADARDDILTTVPAVTRSWQGNGAAIFSGYTPALEQTLDTLTESATATAEAITAFQRSILSLWNSIIDHTSGAAAEVSAVRAAAGGDAMHDVITIVDRYATYVDELTESLLALTRDSHTAGRRLAEAGGDGNETEGWRLPAMSGPAAEPAAWHPGEATVSMDLSAMANLTAALSDSRDCWQQAVAANSRAGQQLTPDAFGLAGRHFHDEVHAVLERDSQGYRDMPGQLDSLAQTLRTVSAGYIQADDDVAAELRRDISDWE